MSAKRAAERIFDLFKNASYFSTRNAEHKEQMLDGWAAIISEEAGASLLSGERTPDATVLLPTAFTADELRAIIAEAKRRNTSPTEVLRLGFAALAKAEPVAPPPLPSHTVGEPCVSPSTYQADRCDSGEERCHLFRATSSPVPPLTKSFTLPCGCIYEQTDVDLRGPVFWNQFNGVVQCHMCGQIYAPLFELARSTPAEAAAPSVDTTEFG